MKLKTFATVNPNLDELSLKTPGGKRHKTGPIPPAQDDGLFEQLDWENVDSNLRPKSWLPPEDVDLFKINLGRNLEFGRICLKKD